MSRPIEPQNEVLHKFDIFPCNPPCKAAPPGAWLGRLPELSALSQTIQLHAPTNMSGGRLDQKMPLHYNLIKLPCGKRLFPRGGPVSSRKNGVYRNQRPGQ